MASLCPISHEDRFASDPLATLPSWKIQQHYQNRVLVGNWAEEREKFIKGTCFGTTTYRADYKRYPYTMPDIREKVLIQKKHQGVPITVLFPHHNIPRSWYYVTHYDEHINRRPNPCLPPLRKWNARRSAWVPERTDFPLIAPPTNFGLLEEKLAKLKRKEDNQPVAYDTIYTLSYGPKSLIPQEPISSYHQPVGEK
ncbi:cilia- and flagella-associated protein 107 [Chiloscyllium punctatum]|uniref:cilia- and flagella-associated protein 107 n=1 Tax=Chiloscyllium punctatum TaxID=137246 RepID=UPI003B637E71